MKKSRFTIVLLSGIFSLVLLAAVQIIWVIDTYRNMRDMYHNQMKSILEEASWQYVTRQTNGNYTLPNIVRLQTILQEELRTSGIESKFMAEVLTTTDNHPVVIWRIGGEGLSTKKETFDQTFTPLTLRLTVDDPHSAIMASMRWILLLQLLATVVLTLSFVYLLRTLFRAKSLEQIRRDLTHNITHELKTPIAAAYAATDALSTTHSIAEDEHLRNEYLDMSLTSLKRLGDMVEEILRTSTEEDNNSKLNLELCNIADIVEEVSATLTLKYKERDVEWHITIAPDAEVVADTLHLQSAISELVDNAIKYCTRKPIVIISVSTDINTTTIVVKDNGAGIPHSERFRIFEKFYRISQGNRHDTKGYGLGLYYVKNIVEGHGGKITLHSIVGKGSEFKITLPRYGKTTYTNS